MPVITPRSREDIQREAIKRVAARRIAAKRAAMPEAMRQAEQRAALLAARQYRQAYPLHQFVQEAWNLIEPQPFVDGWHIAALCDHLQAVTETAAATDVAPNDGEDIRNLLVNLPPRTSKSLLTSVMWPAWVWLSWPSCRWLYASYSKDLALRDAVYARTLMQTGWYQELKHTPWTFTTDANVKSFYANDKQGYRITTSVSAMATGFGGDIRCLPGKTAILTEDGVLPIRDLVKSTCAVRVASVNHQTNTMEWRPITGWHTHRPPGGQELLRIVAGDHSVAMTRNHPVWTEGRGYVPAATVQRGERLMPSVFHGSWHVPVTAVEPAGYADTVYNLTVEGNNNYFAEGILLHNCGDDLHATQEDFSTTRAEITTAKQFWLMTMASRFTDAKRSCQVLGGQRVAIDDVSAEVLKQGDYAYLKIPMEYEPEHAEPPTPLGWVDPRTTEGELLCPARFGPEEVASLKKRLGYRYFTQFQQRPISELSSIFPRSKWKFFQVWPPIEWFDVLIQSWDYRFGDKKQSGSYVAGHLWGRKGPPSTGDVFLLDRVFDRLSFGESVKATVELAEKWPGAYAKLIEQAANGEAIYSTLRSKVFGLILVPVGGRYSSKVARAEAEAFVLDDRRAWLPHPTLAPWVEDYMGNMEAFPSEPQDDTDATSQAWAYLCPPPPAKNTVREAALARGALERQILLAQQRKGRPATMSRTGA